MEDGSVTSTLPATNQNGPSTISNHDTPISVKSSRFKWKNFLQKFNPNRKSVVPKEPTQARPDMYIQDVNDPYAIAISLPDETQGKDMNVSIEMRASSSQSSKSLTPSGLNLFEATAKKSVYYGRILVPTQITAEAISKMPVYFISADKKLNANGQGSQKVETIIQPNEDNMPRNMDKDLIVSQVYLKVNLQHLKHNKKINYKQIKNLNYIFINNETNSKTTKGNILEDNTETTECHSKQYENNVLSKKSSKKLVAVSTLSDKIKTYDISTQYSVALIDKEVQMEKTKPQYSESIYPTDTTSSSILNEQLEYKSLNCYTEKPRFYINFDKDLLLSRSVQFPSPPNDYDYISVVPASGRLSLERREHLFGNEYVIQKNIKDDIDETLRLLENAKNKLISYLSQPISFTKFNREYKYNYHDLKSPAATKYVTGFRYSAPTCLTDFTKAEHETRNWKSSQFFRETTSPEEDLINPSISESTGTLKLNTIQNIYTSESHTDGDTFTRTESQTIQDDLLEKRYTGDHKNNELTYNIVVNDIRSMIRDLLEESRNIKKITLSVTSIESTADDDVRSIISTILERAEDTAVTDKPTYHQPTMCINYCLMDEHIPEDSTHALIDHPNNSEMIFPSSGTSKILKTSWSFGQPKRKPTVSVRRITSNNKRQALFTGGDLISKLDRGAVYIQEICNEMYDVDPKSNDRIIVSGDESFLRPEHDDESSESEIDCQMVVSSFETSSLGEVEEELVGNRFQTPSIEEISRSSDESLCGTGFNKNYARIVDDVNCLVASEVRTVVSPSHAPIIYTCSSSSILSKHSRSIPDSDYDGDNDTISIELPNITHEFSSMQELNNQDEIDYIERNVESNKKLTTAEGNGQDDK